ncbi:transmembrane protein 115-like, partial [Trifolium medium]|nr:transmembrane protein 115-like [Trifolium medium]
RKPETKHKGDPSEDFAFSTFFPEFLRPVIDPIASIFHRMLCGRSDASNDAEDYNLGSEPLPVKEVPEHWKKGWLMRGWLLHGVQGSCKQMLQELYNALDFVNSDKFSQNETIMSDISTVDN